MSARAPRKATHTAKAPQMYFLFMAGRGLVKGHCHEFRAAKSMTKDLSPGKLPSRKNTLPVPCDRFTPMAGAATPPARDAAFPSALLVFLGLGAWAIWSCAEHWRGNPNYSYGWVVPALALGFGLRRYFTLDLGDLAVREGGTAFSWPVALALVLVSCAVVFALEFAREQMWHPQ